MLENVEISEAAASFRFFAPDSNCLIFQSWSLVFHWVAVVECVHCVWLIAIKQKSLTYAIQITFSVLSFWKWLHKTDAEFACVCIIWFLGHSFCQWNINAKFKHNLNSDYSIKFSIILQLPSPAQTGSAYANLFRKTEWDFQFLSGYKSYGLLQIW